MSISFSGLASGLDTSSWVESLTALKRAKIETFTAEKEKYVLNKETLSGIKSFFSSFRSMVEKVTYNSKLILNPGVDLFAQTRALSSNANVVSAITTTGAKDGVYEISVDNLATNTEATSGKNVTTTHTVTSVATMDSTLTSLGVQTGKIGISTNVGERQIRITNDDTIKSFITKLSNIGVNSDYDEKTGVFSVDLNSSQIRDIDNTGIVKALHLKSVNNNYTTGALKTQITNTTVQQATGSTKLSDLGVADSGYIIVKDNNVSPTEKTINISGTTTIDELVKSLNDNGFSASFSDGRITLNDANISYDNVGLKDALGWSDYTTVSSSQTSGSLLYTTTLVEGFAVDKSTLLKNLDTGISVNNGDTIIIEHDGVKSTITLSETSTVGDILDKISSTGASASINDGVVNISDCVIRGGTYDVETAFGLKSDYITSSNVSNKIYITDKLVVKQDDATSTANITYTETKTAQLSDKLSDYTSQTDFIVKYGISTEIPDISDYDTFIEFDSSITFQEMFDKLAEVGIEASLNDGVISLSSSEGLVVYEGLEAFGISLESSPTSQTTVTINITRTSQTLYYTAKVAATMDDKIWDYVNITNTETPSLLILQQPTVNYDTPQIIYSFTIDNSWTFGDLRDELAANSDIIMTMTDGVISLESDSCFVQSASTILSQLGLNVVATATSTIATTSVKVDTITTQTTKVVGSEMESSEALTITKLVKGTSIKTTLTGMNINGSGVTYQQVTPSVIPTLTTALSLKTAFNTKESTMVYTLHTSSTSSTSITSVFATSVFATRTISTTSTVGDLINQLKADGVTANINNNSIILDTSTAFFSSLTNEPGTGIRIGSISTSCGKTVTVTTTKNATEDTRLYELIEKQQGTISTILAGEVIGTVTLFNKDSGKDVTLTFKNTDTIGTVIETLQQYGLTVSLKNFLSVGDISPTINPGYTSIITKPTVNGSTTLASSNSNSRASTNTTVAGFNTSSFISISATDSDYVVGEMSDDLATILGLSGKIGLQESFTASKEDVTVTNTVVTTATGNTTLSELIGGRSCLFTISVFNPNSADNSPIAVSSTLSLNQLAYALNTTGLKASYDETTGKFKFEESDSYIKSITNKNIFIEGLKLSMKSGDSLRFSDTITVDVTSTQTTTVNGTATLVTYSNTSSTTLQGDKELYVNENTKIGDLSTKSSGAMYLDINGSKVGYLVTDDRTVGEVLNFLRSNGLNVTLKSNGTIKISQKLLTGGFINGASTNKTYIDDFGGVFGLTGSNYSTSVKQYTTSSNTDSNVLTATILHTATMATTFAEMGITGSTSFTLHNRFTNTYATVAVASSDTFEDLAEQLKDYGFNFNISNGKASLTSDDYWYFFSSSTRNNMKSIFNIDCTTTYESIQKLLSESDLVNIDSWHEENGNELTQHYNRDVTVHVDGTTSVVHLYDNDGFEDMQRSFAKCGIDLTLKNGQLYFSGKGDIYIEGLESLGIDNNLAAWNPTASYTSKTTLSGSTSTTETRGADKNTKLSDLGITSGEYYLYKNGVKNTLYVSTGDTVGDFLDTLKSLGISAGISDTNKISWSYSGDAHFQTASGGSNIVDKLGNEVAPVQSYGYSAAPTYQKVDKTLANVSLDTTLGEIYSERFATTPSGTTDTLNISLDGNNYTIELNATDTIEDLLSKFRSVGLNATLNNGKITLEAGSRALTISGSGGSSATLSNVLDLQIASSSYSVTDADSPVTASETIVTSRNVAAANYADKNTKLSLLNISAGLLSVYRNGQKASITITNDDTFGSLEAKISSVFSDVKLSFNDGYLTIGSDSAEVVVGTASDSSNFTAITGIMSDENKNCTSARSLYKVNNSSKVMEADLFAGGNVTEGDFKVGEATISITKDTTINDIISQINGNEKASATAYWDNINGNLVIKSKVSGASLINIESGKSNFTDVMGFTKVEGGIKKMNVDNQTVGQNAHFSINGTKFTATSNTVTSETSKIEGVTLNLKDITKEGSVTITIERDTDSLADVMSNVVDSYNTLMENIDKELAAGGKLNDETTLKFIKNQIRTLMTSSFSVGGEFKNLSDIGISLQAAVGGNIRTDNINTLSFDKDKFLTAYTKDSESLKTLLLGTNTQAGVLTSVEKILDSALESVSGYFASAEKAYNTKISNANRAAERYKSRLETKFRSMDILISKFQNQYSSFLS